MAIAKSLAEALREKAAPLVVRRKGARGELPVSVADKIHILVYLTADPDPEISRQALETLEQTSRQELHAVLQDASTAPVVLDFAANHLIERHEELLDALLLNPAFHNSSSPLEEIGAQAGEKSEIPESGSVTAAPPDGNSKAANLRERESTLQKLSRLSPAQKIKRALMGSQGERLILIRDSNKSVARAVVQSPKLTDAEVEAIASMRNVTEEVLRLLAKNRAHLKHYNVVRALVGNPRVPIDVTLPLISHMNDRDLKILALDRNLPEVVRTMAAKNLRDRQATRGSALPKKH
ncbi:MAG: hypothetical protein ACRD2O_01875 [Terriglobia bacterium]